MQALKFFKQAAEHGSADAQFNLGSMYFAGLRKTPIDMTAALKYFSMAAQQGHTVCLAFFSLVLVLHTSLSWDLSNFSSFHSVENRL